MSSFTTLRSTGEVNAIPTSFSPFGPAISGSSTALPTLGGVYDGARGDDTFSFRIKNTAIVGSNQRLKIEVNDGAGRRIANLQFDGVPPGSPVSLANGLTLAFGPGQLVEGEGFTLEVFASVGSAVDPTQPFDGTRNEIPNFEPGLPVRAGAFEVNGVAISVAASDSIESVLARITASAAGVDARFDAAQERVVLAQRSPGSSPRIALSGDTSGFLAAFKLAGAVAVPGQDGADPVLLPIASIPALAGIASGSFSANGVVLAVDVGRDSLADVLDRINASAAGVTASLEPTSRRVNVISRDPAATLELADETTGFWSGLRVPTGSHRPRTASAALRARDPAFARPDLVNRGLRDVRESLHALLDTVPRTTGGEGTSLRAALGEVLDQAFATRSGRRAAWQLGLARLDSSRDFEAPLGLDSARFARALSKRAGALHAFLFAEATDTRAGGLLPTLLQRVRAEQERVAELLGGDAQLGSELDLSA